MKPIPSILYIIALSVFASAATAGMGPPEQVLSALEKYRQGEDFKCFALYTPQNGESWISGYAQGYDTPQNAARAALLYCREALAESGISGRDCELSRAGRHEIGTGTDSRDILEKYGEEVLAALKSRLEKGHDPRAWTKLETVYQKMGLYAESEAMLLGPAEEGNPEAQNALAYHWAERNVRLDEALEMARKATEQQPGNPSYLDTMAMCLLRLGDLEQAEDVERKALSLNPGGRFLPVIMEHLGDILWLRGKKGKAREAWSRGREASGNILISRRLERKLAHGLENGPVFE